MNEPTICQKVSVVIPTYNRAALVRQCIESVCKQRYSNLEILVVDDGSTDDTKDIVKNIGDKRIAYFYKSNGGASSARDYGLCRVNGEYICFLDSDDLWPEDFLSIVLMHLRQSPGSKAAYTKILCIQQDGTEKEMSHPGRYLSGILVKDFFQRGPSLFLSSICFHRGVWEGFYFDENLRCGEDFDVFVRMSPWTKFLFVPNAYAIKRWSNNNLPDVSVCLATFHGAYSLERFYFLWVDINM